MIHDIIIGWLILAAGVIIGLLIHKPPYDPYD
jgi:hypothetical protein